MPPYCENHKQFYERVLNWKKKVFVMICTKCSEEANTHVQDT